MMRVIDYSDILKKSWKITWKNKFLWWFGLFLALGGGININFPGGDWGKQLNGVGVSMDVIFKEHMILLVLLLILIVLIMLTLLVFKILVYAGIIRSLNAIEKNEQGGFKRGLAAGKKYFWKLLAVSLLAGLFVVCIAVVLALPVAVLFYLKSVVFGGLATFFAILIFIPVIVMVSYVAKYARYYIVLSELEIRDSLEAGYFLFRKNIFESIVMSFFFIPIVFLLGFALLILLVCMAVIFIAIGLLLYIFILKAGAIVVLAAGIVLFLMAALAAGSVYQVFYQTVWFLFFKEIASIKEEEKVEEPVKQAIEKTLSNPERA
jgi:hypothetical protein